MNNDVMKGIIPLMGVVMMAGVLQMIIPQPPPEPPPPEPTGFGCPYCTLLFDTMSELVAHINEVHPEMPPFVEIDIGWG